jgi:CBS domain containing-hemolysin-like protein
MNQNSQPAAALDSAGDRDSEQSEEAQSTGAASSGKPPSLFKRLSALLGGRNGSTIRDDLEDALADHGTDAASFSPGERAMLHNILRLREVRVVDVMVPRAEIEAMDIDTSLAELLIKFETSGHSRMPVYAETLDDPRGMVHIRDVVAHITRSSGHKKGRNGRQANRSPSNKPKTRTVPSLDLAKVDLGRGIGEVDLVRPVLFVPPSMLATDLMARMQAGRIQMALVIDEYGGTDGLVSLEDIVEMVVGDIEDEHDEDEPMVVKTGEGTFVVDGKAEIEEVAEMIGEAFKAGEHEEDVDTIGGMIFNTLGRVPVRGEVVQAIPGFEFHVLDADPRRVKRVRIVQSRAADRRRRLPRPFAGIDA